MKKLMKCTACGAPDHAVDCPECLGWGKMKNGTIITAHASEWRKKDRNWVRCPTCKGSPEGQTP